MECTKYGSTPPPPPHTSFYLHGDAETLIAVACASMALKEAIGASVRAHGA